MECAHKLGKGHVSHFRFSLFLGLVDRLSFVLDRVHSKPLFTRWDGTYVLLCPVTIFFGRIPTILGVAALEFPGHKTIMRANPIALALVLYLFLFLFRHFSFFLLERFLSLASQQHSTDTHTHDHTNNTRSHHNK